MDCDFQSWESTRSAFLILGTAMLYKLGRLLQLIGMLILPAAIAGNFAGQLATKGELILLGIGVLVFYIGWRIQEAGKA
jgi:hypothetical protein